MKKNILFLFEFFVIFLLTFGFFIGCKNSKKSLNEKVQLANPFVECKTLTEAKNLTGFDFVLPNSIENYSEKNISVCNNQMIQVVYKNESETQELVIRKSFGNEDISGDYNNYSLEQKIDVQKVPILAKGNNQKFNCAIWNQNNYSFSVYSSAGLDQKNLIELVSQIH